MPRHLVTKDSKVKASKRKYDRASRFFNWQIAKVRTYRQNRREAWDLPVRNLSVLGALKGGPWKQPSFALAITHRKWHFSPYGDLLDALFASNFTLDDHRITPPTIPRFQSSEVKLNQKAIRRALSSLDRHKSNGPDNISPWVLRSSAPELPPVLTRLFRHSYSVGVLIDSWKSALIHPIPKKRDVSDPSNYRPVAITTLLTKMMESITNSQLLVYLTDHRLINNRQYGLVAMVAEPVIFWHVRG